MSTQSLRRRRGRRSPGEAALDAVGTVVHAAAGYVGSALVWRSARRDGR